MKKIIIILFAVSFFMGINSFHIKAEGNMPFLENILDLSNILIYDNPEHTHSEYYFKTVEPIKLISGEMYTFVISEDFFDDRSFGHILNEYEIFYTFIDPVNETTVGKSNVYIYSGKYAYVSFIAVYSLLEIVEFAIEKIPTLPNLDMMLYQGDISLFNGKYTNYKSQYEPINWFYLKDYDEVLTKEEIISSIDIVNREETTFEIILDEYTTNQNKTGEYPIILMANNKSNNKSFLKITVKIVDITPPVFTGETIYNLELKPTMPDLLEVISLIEVEDNYSTLSKSDIKVTMDHYTWGKNRVGTYNVTLEAEDASNNKSIYEVIINVIDITPPVINGPREIFRYSTDSILSNNDIKKFFTATDGVDGDLTDNLIVEGNYENIPGVYEYTISALDYSNNIQTQTLLINVIDGNYPVFIDNDNYIITYNKYKNMTYEEIKNWILGKNTEATNFLILLDESTYLKDKDEPMYVYYSYMVQGNTFYGRALITPSSEKTIANIIIFSSLIVLNIGIVVAFIKRPKIHL